MSILNCTWCGRKNGKNNDEIVQLVMYKDQGKFFCSKKCLHDWNNAEGYQGKRLKFIETSKQEPLSFLKYTWEDYDEYYEHGLYVYMEQEKYELAIMDFTESIKQHPQKIESYIKRGNAYRYLSQLENAFADYNKAIELDAKNPFVYMERAFCYQEQDNDEMAINDFTNAINYGINSPWVFFSRGLSYYELKKYNLLKNDFIEAISRDNVNNEVKETIKEFLYEKEKIDFELMKYFCDFKI